MDIKGLHNNPSNTDKTKSSGRGVAAADANKASSESNTSSTTSTARDSVNISTEAKALNQLASKIKADAPVNQEKVNALRAAIAEGTHKPNARAIADKILQFDADFQ